VPGDLNGLRIGTPEIARWGMAPAHMSALGTLIAGALSGSVEPESLAPEVTQLRRKFNKLHYVR
jgi:glycine hydroxymethyltransferase